MLTFLTNNMLLHIINPICQTNKITTVLCGTIKNVTCMLISDEYLVNSINMCTLNQIKTRTT